MKKKNKGKITQKLIGEAIKKFQTQGGLINQLPDELTPRSYLVGARYGMFENVTGNPLHPESATFF